MNIEIVDFPETKIAVVEHSGAPEKEYESVNQLVAWRMANKLPPSDLHKSYGIHYNDPNQVRSSEYRVDLCVSVLQDVSANSFGVVNKTIPALRCAKVRHLGSRENVTAARYLYEEWLASSGEQLAEFPVFFHYVNVGPQIQESDMITDVYLPLL
ncbi:MAG: AraC family transcriptional regulator [Candidatus Azotimanducaceae bacterium]|jgi:AraC family transcriptional regulator